MSDGGARRGSAAGVLEAGAFFAELLMLGALVYAGVALGGSPAGRIGLAVGLPVVVGAVWARWLAPRAARRLPMRPGLVLKIVLFAGTSALLAWAGPLWLGMVFLLVTGSVVIAAERGRRPL